ncbi:MAG: hypothetical protein QXW14_01715 [Candidatus Nitrosocaldus sp.]
MRLWRVLFSITIAVSCIIILLYNPIHAATTPNETYIKMKDR